MPERKGNEVRQSIILCSGIITLLRGWACIMSVLLLKSSATVLERLNTKHNQTAISADISLIVWTFEIRPHYCILKLSLLSKI